MKYLIFIFILTTSTAWGQQSQDSIDLATTNDTLYTGLILDEFTYRDPQARSDMKYLKSNVKEVYPYAEYAVDILHQVEQETRGMSRNLKIKNAARPYYKKLKSKFKYVVKDMTESEGHALTKIIHYKTNRTIYSIMQKYRGKVRAGFWQMLSGAWDQDLKTKFDPKRDWMLKKVLKQIEAGQVQVKDQAEAMSREDFKADN